MAAVETHDWEGVLTTYAAEPESGRRLVAQLRACEVSALAFCRLLERWARGDAAPCSPGQREAALQHAADRVETAISGLEKPVARYLLELEPDVAEGRSWYGEPGPAELLEWDAVLTRAGVHASPVRVAQAYLELAVLVRALEGLSDRARIGAPPDRNSLWAGLFDLRENLFGCALEDLRALAA